MRASVLKPLALLLLLPFLTGAAGPPAISSGSSSPALPEEVRATASTLRDQALQGTRAFEIVASLTNETGPRPAGAPPRRRSSARWPS